MNNKSTIVRAILLDASECERPEADHPAAIEISAEDLQRILERHITAEPQATPFMWAIQEPGGGAYMDEGCVSSVREDVQAEVDGLNSGLDADDDPYQVVPVYLAAAPQAVQVAVPMVNMTPPATQRDRWMYEQGRLAERDARTVGSVAAATLATTQPAAQGMEALPMQASEGIEDVAGMEHPEWMLVHKETGAQKPLDSQWTVRATQPAAQGMDAGDKELLDFLQAESLDLLCFARPTGGDDADIGWRTVQHHMGQPSERIASEVYDDDPRRAIREAMARLKRDPYCTGPLHEDDAALAAQAKQGGAA